MESIGPTLTTFCWAGWPGETQSEIGGAVGRLLLLQNASAAGQLLYSVFVSICIYVCVVNSLSPCCLWPPGLLRVGKEVLELLLLSSA